MSSTAPMHNATTNPTLNPHQTRAQAPTAYEDALGDAIEKAFGTGHWELDALLAQLSASGSTAPDGAAWTAQNFQALMAQLGQ